MDTLNKKTRSAVMARIRSKGNRSTELRLRSLLSRAGFRGWCVQPEGITGKPDFAFLEKRVVVFVDSCFWHGCPKHLRRPKSNKSYWQTKIDGNKRRDKKQTAQLRAQGWKVLRVWEHALLDYENIVKVFRRELGLRLS